MSWIKPNFLWMMYRSGWGTKSNQEVTLAVRLRRSFFDSILAAAVPSSWDRSRFATEEEWSHAVAVGGPASMGPRPPPVRRQTGAAGNSTRLAR